MSENTVKASGCSWKHLRLAMWIVAPVLALGVTLTNMMNSDLRAEQMRASQMRSALEERLRIAERSVAAQEERWNEVQRSLSRIEKQLERRTP